MFVFVFVWVIGCVWVWCVWCVCGGGWVGGWVGVVCVYVYISLFFFRSQCTVKGINHCFNFVLFLYYVNL